jgi:hypothetical protein
MAGILLSGLNRLEMHRHKDKGCNVYKQRSTYAAKLNQSQFHVFRHLHMPSWILIPFDNEWGVHAKAVPL